MKSLFVLILSFVVLPFTAKKTEPATIPVCHTPANDMALLAASHSFQMLHAEPVPFHYTGLGDMVTIPTADGTPAGGFLLKAKKPTDKWLLVYQEWWGLNDNIKKQAESFYNDLGNVNVLALDMYDGQVTDKREEAGKIMSSVKQERLEAIMRGAIAYAGPKAQFGSVGWCFGGMLSLKSALLEGKKAKACVMYYGRPEQDVEKLKTLDTDVLGIFGSRDKGISPTMVKQFEENMAKAGEKVTIKMYDADHGFANPSNPIYDATAAADAYKLALAYLKERL